MIWMLNIMENASISNSSANSTLSEMASTPKIVDFIENILLLKIYTILLFVVGFVGNSITIFILSKKHSRSSSTANFLLALAFSDNVILCIVPLSDWLKSMLDIDVRNLSPVGCKIHIFMAYVPVSISSWLLACVTIERVVSVVWPHKVKDVFTLKRTRTCISFTVLTLSAFFCHFLFGYQTNHDPNIPQMCIDTGAQYIYFRRYIFPYLDFLVIFLLPCIIILVGNAWIIYTLRKMRERRNAMTSNDGKNVNSVTKTLILIGVVFVITVSPVSIFYIAYGYILPLFEPWLTLFLTSLLNELAATNAGINFFLYVLTGRKFRDEVRAMFKCKRVDKLSDRSAFGTDLRTTSTNHDKRSVFVVDMPGTSDTAPSN